MPIHILTFVDNLPSLAWISFNPVTRSVVVGFNYKMIFLILEWKEVSKVILVLLYTIFL